MRNRIYRFKVILLAAFFLYSSLIAPALWAKILYGEGEAYIFKSQEKKAKKQALANAKRDILLQDLNSILGEKRVRENFSLLQKVILINTNHYLIKIKVLQSSIKEGSYFLNIQAEPNRSRIKSALLENKIIFPEEKKQKFFLLYLPKNPASYYINNQNTKTLFATIRNQGTTFSLIYDFNLNAKLLNSDISKIKKKLKLLGFDGVAIIDLYSLPVLEEGFFFQQYNITSSIVLNELNIKNIDTNKISFPIYTNSKKNSADYKKVLDFSIEQLADILSSYMDDYLGNYYAIEKPKRFTLEFQNFSLLELRKIEEILKTLQGYQKIRSQVLGNKHKIFYFSSLNFNRLYNNFTTLMTKNNIKYKIDSQSSLQIYFSKKYN